MFSEAKRAIKTDNLKIDGAQYIFKKTVATKEFGKVVTAPRVTLTEKSLTLWKSVTSRRCSKAK